MAGTLNVYLDYDEWYPMISKIEVVMTTEPYAAEVDAALVTNYEKAQADFWVAHKALREAHKEALAAKGAKGRQRR